MMTEKRGRKPIGDKVMTDAQRQAKRMVELKQKAANFDTMGRLAARMQFLEKAVGDAYDELLGTAEEARKGAEAFSVPTSFEPAELILRRRIDAALKILGWAKNGAL